ncbi:MAG TPA: TetR family transcriptional regulator [Phenylobacterium sp.]|uniref:TetR family transcriptional regulator n=1 Tax=Phenylobacterium sp. TaxID=1871053 RepID=UPI002B4682D0|nr:TetR family transcriptional regulator [Phenylobacterium sp.]HKR89633.1 TetR family transcriptional regulator [Phenylobacterium sp.]
MSTAAKPTERSPSRAVLLQAAAELMIERGSIEISLQEIAARSGLNAALVKYYFGGKSGLMLALAEDVLGASLEQMRGLLAMDLSVVDKLRLHIKGVVNVYFRFPFINRLIHSMLLDPDLGKRVAEKISKPLAETQRSLLQEGIDSGVFKPINPMIFYFIVLGACEEIFFSQHVLRHAFGVDGLDEQLKREYSDTLLDLVLNGLLANPPKARR